MADFTELFDFPPTFAFENLPCLDKKLCIVSVIGKGKLNDFTTKASILNPVLDRDVFRGRESYLQQRVTQGDIECFLDADQHILYLHHQSYYDTSLLVEKCRQLSQSSTEDFTSLSQEEEFKHAKVFLFLFSVSHIILLCHPGSTFDLHYVKLFRIMDQMRLRLQSSVTDLLRELSVSREWANAGRPCSPRVLFIFQTPTFDSGTDDNFDSMIISKSRSQKMPPIKKLQHNIEDQIYRILRRARVITNISNNSLFAVPANQEFVFIHCRRNEASDPVKFFLQQLRNNCFTGKESESVRPRSYLVSRRGNQPGPVLSETSRTTSAPPRGVEHSLKEFLWKHVNLAFSKGFDDNVGRHPIPSVFEMPTGELWFAVATRLYDFYFSPDTKTQATLTTFQSLLETDVRFSERCCSRVIPLAENSYRQELPQHYVTTYHLKRLAQAKHTYAQQARGPAFDKYLLQLEAACRDYWLAGHQQCEQRSLTNKLCTNPRHRLLEDPETEENRGLPIMPHSSGLKTKAACNCGRKQAEKDDPFDHRSANFDFFEALSVLCCSQLTRLSLPVFQPGASGDMCPSALAALLPPHSSPPSLVTPSAHLSSLVTPSTGDSDRHGLSPESRDEKNRGESVPGSSLSLALSLGQSGCSDLYSHASLNTDHADHNDHHLEEHLNVVVEDPAVVVAVPQRQHSLTEYLPYMLHMESPPSLLPKFPSWAISCLGKASAYCPMQGLEQPGFLSGSNFLLPWEILTRPETKERWPTVGETAAAKKNRQRRLGKDDPGTKAYVGLEYECPRGHRFFCSAPDKIFKVANPALLKDTASKLLGTDMPLYTSCHCRSPKGFMAQLMRAFVVTPESSQVRILLKARVQPGPLPSPVFHPGPETPVTLPAGGVWVLRLPHVYVGELGPYTMPQDAVSLAACRLMKGIFTYQETSPDG